LNRRARWLSQWGGLWRHRVEAGVRQRLLLRRFSNEARSVIVVLRIAPSYGAKQGGNERNAHHGAAAVPMPRRRGVGITIGLNVFVVGHEELLRFMIF
jgi:hypothetical protein